MADLADLEVMIVDDHPAMRALLRQVLERAGCGAVRDAASAGDALNALEQRPAQLILVDQNMPGLSGEEFIARVRAKGGAARIVLITGDGHAGLRGADALLVKPISPRDLLAAIERLLSY